MAKLPSQLLEHDDPRGLFEAFTPAQPNHWPWTTAEAAEDAAYLNQAVRSGEHSFTATSLLSTVDTLIMPPVAEQDTVVRGLVVESPELEETQGRRTLRQLLGRIAMRVTSALRRGNPENVELVPVPSATVVLGRHALEAKRSGMVSVADLTERIEHERAADHTKEEQRRGEAHLAQQVERRQGVIEKLAVLRQEQLKNEAESLRAKAAAIAHRVSGTMNQDDTLPKRIPKKGGGDIETTTRAYWAK